MTVPEPEQLQRFQILVGNRIAEIVHEILIILEISRLVDALLAGRYHLHHQPYPVGEYVAQKDAAGLRGMLGVALPYDGIISLVAENDCGAVLAHALRHLRVPGTW